MDSERRRDQLTPHEKTAADAIIAYLLEHGDLPPASEVRVEQDANGRLVGKVIAVDPKEIEKKLDKGTPFTF